MVAQVCQCEELYLVHSAERGVRGFVHCSWASQAGTSGKKKTCLPMQET